MSHGEGHTALPWAVGSAVQTLVLSLPALATVANTNGPADAALIVRAVNHHDRLYALAVRAEQELICAQSYASSRRVMSGPGLAIMAKLIEQLHAELETIRKGE